MIIMNKLLVIYNGEEMVKLEEKIGNRHVGNFAFFGGGGGRGL